MEKDSGLFWSTAQCFTAACLYFQTLTSRGRHCIIFFIRFQPLSLSQVESRDTPKDQLGGSCKTTTASVTSSHKYIYLISAKCRPAKPLVMFRLLWHPRKPGHAQHFTSNEKRHISETPAPYPPLLLFMLSLLEVFYLISFFRFLKKNGLVFFVHFVLWLAISKVQSHRVIVVSEWHFYFVFHLFPFYKMLDLMSDEENRKPLHTFWNDEIISDHYDVQTL